MIPESRQSNPLVTAQQAALNSFLLNQFETEGGVFPYNTREYLASGRLDHRFDANNELSLTYRYGHDLEESPDVHSLDRFFGGKFDPRLRQYLASHLVPPAQSDRPE